MGVRDILANLIPPQKARLIYGAYDIVGDLVVTKVPAELDEYEREVGEAIHLAHPGVRRVFRVIGETKEIERNRLLRAIWPESPQNGRDGGTHTSGWSRTIYREQGCRFVVDVEKVFFTPRLSYERMRVARQVKSREVAANLFGGVGTYAIIIAKVCPEVERTYSIDVNPNADELSRENVVINKCWNKVMPILGDAKIVCRDELKGVCDRVIMPLPENAKYFLDSAVTALKEGCECTINFYAEISGKEVENEVHKVVDETKKRIVSSGAKSCEAICWRIVREVGARRYHVAIDLRVVK
ncbi:MAG: hypothetical protein WED04_11775 [Promethearchaeati archaeon SRVP18_Atabeyarchaeia-1]